MEKLLIVFNFICILSDSHPSHLMLLEVWSHTKNLKDLFLLFKHTLDFCEILVIILNFLLQLKVFFLGIRLCRSFLSVELHMQCWDTENVQPFENLGKSYDVNVVFLKLKECLLILEIVKEILKFVIILIIKRDQNVQNDLEIFFSQVLNYQILIFSQIFKWENW